MTAKMVDQRQLDLFQGRLFDQLDPNDPLVMPHQSNPMGCFGKEVLRLLSQAWQKCQSDTFDLDFGGLFL